MQIKLIGIRASALGHRIKPLASASAATIVGVGAGEKKNRMIRAAMRRLQLTRIDPKSVGYAYSYDYGHGYGYLGRLLSYGCYSGAPDDPKRLAKPTLN